MITSFTAILFNILANLSRRILKSELSKLTQRVQMAECDEIDLNRRIKELTDENSRLGKAGLQLVTECKTLEGRLARETAAAVDIGRDRYKLIDENKSLTTEIGRLTQALSDSGNENRTLLAQLKETASKLDTALLEAHNLKTDRDRLSRCIKDITDTLKFHQKQTQAGTQVPQPITDWRLNTFGADSGTTETPMNSTQKVT